MLIRLCRHTFTETSTIGTISIGSRTWYCIEDRDRGLKQDMSLAYIQSVKVYGQTAIPYGMYKVLITQSPRFSKKAGRPVFTPQLLNVPGFEGIRIHPANYASQLEGCVAPGVTMGKNMVGDSKTASREITELISASLKIGDDVWIEIIKETVL